MLLQRDMADWLKNLEQKFTVTPQRMRMYVHALDLERVGGEQVEGGVLIDFDPSFLRVGSWTRSLKSSRRVWQRWDRKW